MCYLVYTNFQREGAVLNYTKPFITDSLIYIVCEGNVVTTPTPGKRGHLGTFSGQSQVDLVTRATIPPKNRWKKWPPER